VGRCNDDKNFWRGVSISLLDNCTACSLIRAHVIVANYVQVSFRCRKR